MHSTAALVAPPGLVARTRCLPGVSDALSPLLLAAPRPESAHVPACCSLSLLWWAFSCAQAHCPGDVSTKMNPSAVGLRCPMPHDYCECSLDQFGTGTMIRCPLHPRLL